MENFFLEEIHKAEKDFPYINLEEFNMNYMAHFHEDIELIFVYAGTIMLSLGGKTLELKKDDICIVMPGEIHGITTPVSSRLYIMKIYADPELSMLAINGWISPSLPYYRAFRDIVDGIASEYSRKKSGYRYAIRAEINLLIMDIIRCLRPEKPSPELRRESARRIEFLDTVNRYIEEHADSAISLDEIACHTHFSKYYFAHLFKSITGSTFGEYVTIFRIERSKQLLPITKSITEVAYRCGFHNLRSYNRCFQKYCNCTPLQYKKQYK